MQPPDQLRLSPLSTTLVPVRNPSEPLKMLGRLIQFCSWLAFAHPVLDGSKVCVSYTYRWS